MTDVLERLRAANPVTDLRFEIPPLASPTLRERAPRRTRPLVVVLAALAAGAALAVVGLPGDRENPSNIALAAARALEPGKSILHVVMRSTQRGPDVADGTVTSELWLAPGGTRGRERAVRENGRVLVDARLAPAGAKPGVLDPIAAVRDQLRNGTLVAHGQVRVGGRLLRRFVSRRGFTWYFDARTLMPVQMIYRPLPGHGRFVAKLIVLRYERLPNSAANRRLLTPSRTVRPVPLAPLRRPATRTTPG